MTPADWKSTHAGLGSCFHQALHRWADLRAEGEIYKVAIGIVAANGSEPRHLHAWLQRPDDSFVISAVTGDRAPRAGFYRFLGIERDTIRLVNPRSIMRSRGGVIDGETVTALLNESGLPWHVVNGGVLPK